MLDFGLFFSRNLFPPNMCPCYLSHFAFPPPPPKKTPSDFLLFFFFFGGDEPTPFRHFCSKHTKKFFFKEGEEVASVGGDGESGGDDGDGEDGRRGGEA